MNQTDTLILSLFTKYLRSDQKTLQGIERYLAEFGECLSPKALEILNTFLESEV